MLTDAIKFYNETDDDPMVPIPALLRQADFQDIYNYFAYELPFAPVWGASQAGNDYFMRKQRGLPSDEILQYEVEQNTCLLWNEIHPDAIREEFPPYEEAAQEIEIQEPLLDEPLVPPPRITMTNFSYIRGQAPPGMYQPGYLLFASGSHGAGSRGGGSGGGQPAQPLLPPDPRYVLP